MAAYHVNDIVHLIHKRGGVKPDRDLVQLILNVIRADEAIRSEREVEIEQEIFQEIYREQWGD